jgi:hypothetical protein
MTVVEITGRMMAQRIWTVIKTHDVQPDRKADNGGENAKFSSHNKGSHEVQGGKGTIYKVPAIELVTNDETKDIEFGEDE